MDASLCHLTVTKTDSTKAAPKANISHEVQNRFLKLMLDKHSKVGAHEQLKKLWTQWVKISYDEEQQPSSCQPILGVGSVATPPGTPLTEEEGAAAAADAAAVAAEGGPA